MQTPIVVGDNVYACFDTGVLSCFDAKSVDLHFRDGRQVRSVDLDAPEQVPGGAVLGDVPVRVPTGVRQDVRPGTGVEVDGRRREGAGDENIFGFGDE